MEIGRGKKIWLIWVDWENRVISFREAEGFEKRVYSSREEMLQFAVDMGNAGFGIQ